MELEPNMYVRYISGFNNDKPIVRIGKVIKVLEYVIELDTFRSGVFSKSDFLKLCMVGKPSFNSIDLIEPGDLMYIDISHDNYGGIVVPRVAETLSELSYWIEEIKSGRCILKAILTKEQIVNNWYEVSNNVI